MDLQDAKKRLKAAEGHDDDTVLSKALLAAKDCLKAPKSLIDLSEKDAVKEREVDVHVVGENVESSSNLIDEEPEAMIEREERQGELASTYIMVHARS